jgi:hypothetical protein
VKTQADNGAVTFFCDLRAALAHTLRTQGEATRTETVLRQR